MEMVAQQRLFFLYRSLNPATVEVIYILFKPVDVDALEEVEPSVAPLSLVSVVEENLHATLQLDTWHAIVGKDRTPS